MNRRQLLLGLGAAAVAGCVSPVAVLRTSATSSPARLPGFTVLPFAYGRFAMKGKLLAAWLATRTTITSHMHMFGGLAAEHLAEHLASRG